MIFSHSSYGAGATVVQHDDPTTNLEMTSWDGGDPHSSGCYCPFCMAGFTSYLAEVLNSTVKAKFNITDAFNYKDYLLGNGTSTTTTTTTTTTTVKTKRRKLGTGK